MPTEPCTLFLEEVLELEKAVKTRIDDLESSKPNDPYELAQHMTDLLNCRTGAKKLRLIAAKRERAPSANHGRPRRTAQIGDVFPGYFVSNYQQLETERTSDDTTSSAETK